MLQNGGPIGNGAITDKNDMGVQAAARLESHVIQITERVGAIMKIEIREGEAFLSLQPRQQRASDQWHYKAAFRFSPSALHER